jgi:hypothetical protein
MSGGGVKMIDLITVSMAAAGTVALCVSFVHYKVEKSKISEISKIE